ncbi:prolyl-tRNA synthetase associated domain-containing protein [Eubacterium sp.]
MGKQEIYSYLNEKNIWHEITEHKAVYNMADLAYVEIPYPDGDAKNIFIRDDKKKNFYLITVKGDKRVDLKTFRTVYETRPLSFVSEKDMVKMIGLHPGSVTPLGILNDEERKIKVYIDKCLLDRQGIIGVHPNDNTATVWLKTNDLIEIIKEHGNEVYLMENM